MIIFKALLHGKKIIKRLYKHVRTFMYDRDLSVIIKTKTDSGVEPLGTDNIQTLSTVSLYNFYEDCSVGPCSSPVDELAIIRGFVVFFSFCTFLRMYISLLFM